MDELDNRDSIPPASPGLPRIQTAFLIFVLIVYPSLGVIMGLSGSTNPAEITSKISQVYFPTLLIQIAMIALLWIVLYKSRTLFAEIGLARKDINMSNIGSAIIFFFGAWGLMTIIRISVERSGYLPQPDFYKLLPADAFEGAFWIILSVGAALSEELIFRGFVITRIRIISGRFWIGAVLGSLAFSMGHLYQGLAGVLLTFLYGMLFAGLFAARKTVFPCVVAHFLQDFIVLGTLFARI